MLNPDGNRYERRYADELLRADANSSEPRCDDTSRNRETCLDLSGTRDSESWVEFILVLVSGAAAACCSSWTAWAVRLMITVALSVCLFLLASSSISALVPFSIGVRVAGLAVLLAAVLWRRRLTGEMSPVRLAPTAVTIGAGFGLYLAASTLLHGNVVGFVIGLLPLLLTVLEVAVLFRYYSTPQVINGLYIALLVICVASLFAYQGMPDVAIERLRLRGLMENANGLGFVAFVLGVASLASIRRLWESVLGILVALACLLLSASRASSIALAIAIVVLGACGVKRARATIPVAVVAISVAWLVEPSILTSPLLFRTEDSRSVGFELLWQVMSDSFWVGMGELPIDTAVAGSPIAAGITGGILGMVGLGLMYVGLFRGFGSYRPHTLALVLAGVVHSLFESWMLSFAAPMLLTVSVALVGFVKVDMSLSMGTQERLRALRHSGRRAAYVARPAIRGIRR